MRSSEVDPVYGEIAANPLWSIALASMVLVRLQLIITSRSLYRGNTQDLIAFLETSINEMSSEGPEDTPDQRQIKKAWRELALSEIQHVRRVTSEADTSA